jgi:GNAT superfamily N-acetyltransferase
MDYAFERISAFPRGTLLRLLESGYSFDARCARCWRDDWRAFDDFFFAQTRIADSCGFITTLDGRAIGFVSWDPRKRPESVEIGHNCILTEHKGNGYGRMQMREAVRRIRKLEAKRILVTTNALLIPAQRMCESVGFKACGRRKNDGSAQFSGDYIDYVLEIAPRNGVRAQKEASNL